MNGHSLAGPVSTPLAPSLSSPHADVDADRVDPAIGQSGNLAIGPSYLLETNASFGTCVMRQARSASPEATMKWSPASTMPVVKTTSRR